MNKFKRFLSILTITFLSVLFMSTFFSSVADAGSLLEELFSAGDQGLSFADFEPGEDLAFSGEGLNPSLTTESSFRGFVIRVVNFALGFLGLFAVIIVIYGGFLYVSAGGEEENTQKGKKAILYATIGLLIVMGSFAFVNTIIGSVEEGGGGTGQYVVGANVGNSFNASSIQVRSSAEDVYRGFTLYAEAAEEIKSLYSDLNQVSLDPSRSIVSQQNMINYLFSVQQKLLNLRSKVTRFSSSYVKINELLNYIQSSMGEIKNLKVGTYYKVTVQDGNTIFDSAPPVECTLDTCKISGLANGFTDGVYYPENLYQRWSEVRNNLLDDNPTGNAQSLSYILEPIKVNYVTQINDHLDDLVQVRQSLTGIQAVEAGDIGTIYNDMMKCYDSATYPAGSLCSKGFLQELTDWTVVSDATKIDQAGSVLYNALERQLELANEIENLQSVSAHLRANVTNGNSPLVVTFDVLDSIDPAGGTIIADNIQWNLTGQLTFEGESVQGQNLNSVTLTNDLVTCEEPTGEDADLFGTVFRQCIFKRPGTYVATVTVNSNDPTKYVSGMSALVIKVNPPTTRINLDMILPDSQTVTVMSYYEDFGILKVDRDYIPVTLEEAKNITFDAKDTQNVQNFKWDFGDGESIETDGNGVQPHSFDKEGKYTVELEVLNQLAEIDRKIFTLDVRNVAARINVSPSEDIFIKRAVLIDGTLSSSSSGGIKSYEWKITKLSGDKEEVKLGNDINKTSFSHEFQEPGKYQIDLKVTSDLETVSAEPFIVTVESKLPVAQFTHSVPQKNQPSTIQFDADPSYDPDGEENNLEYEWTIQPASNGGQNWEWVGGSSLSDTVTGKDPVIKFKNKGNYEVTLKVSDATTVGSGLDREFGTNTETIAIDNLLDIAWANNQDVTAIIGDDGKATINFNILSDNGVAYEINFGDDETSLGDISKTKSIPHSYTQAGIFDVEVTVYDAEDNDDSIQRRVFIGGGDKPIAKSALFINGVEITNLAEAIEVSKNDILTFDAGGSKNLDGTGRDLKYSWDFGDTTKSSNKSATHSYGELSPDDPGYFLVTLSVFDKDEPDKASMDNIKIRVLNKAPKFVSIQATPDNISANLVTPVGVNMRVFGGEDEDGEITQYRWWYFDVDDPDEPLGIQVTQSPTTKLTIGTRGKEGQEVTYGFGLEVTDSDNLTASSEDLLQSAQIPKIKVTNGANALPTAKFNVDTTSIFTGDKVTFTSSSSDPDGKIVSYIWDFEGDGFFNNAPTKNPSIEHSFSGKKTAGYEVRLKVIDDKGGEAVSEVVKIFVDTLASPPTAAFKFEVIPGSGGKKVRFINNSTVDSAAGAEILSYVWDFDTSSASASADSDGDGVKDNDTDSKASNPERLYTALGSYNVKLTVTDNQGNSDSVINLVTIPLADPPTAAFTYEVVDGIVTFKNNSTSDTAKGALITKYQWDFDVDSLLPTADSNGDGNKANDSDSTAKEPIHSYTATGSYRVKLTVTDNQGTSDEVINEINTTAGSGNINTPLTQQESVIAVLKTIPAPKSDGIVYIKGNTGSVVFNFKDSIGSIANYTFDKNIYFDTDKNGITTDDQDFKTILPGTWTTNFDKEWGQTVVKLTVTDIYGNTHSVAQEIKFE